MDLIALDTLILIYENKFTCCKENEEELLKEFIKDLKELKDVFTILNGDWIKKNNAELE